MLIAAAAIAVLGWAFLPRGMVVSGACRSDAANAVINAALEARAAAGDANAAYRLSSIYARGQDRDGGKSHAYLMMAAEGGEAGAEDEVAGEFLIQDQMDPDPARKSGAGCSHPEQVRKWLTRAAEHGYGNAQLMLSQYYQSGDCGFPKDGVEAYSWDIISGNSGAPLASIVTELKMTPAQVQEATARAAAWHVPRYDENAALRGIEWYYQPGKTCCTMGETCEPAHMFE